MKGSTCASLPVIQFGAVALAAIPVMAVTLGKGGPVASEKDQPLALHLDSTPVGAFDTVAPASDDRELKAGDKIACASYFLG